MSATGEHPSLPLGRGVQVILRDANGLIALAKPAGVLSHPNTPADEPRALLDCKYHADGEFFDWQADGALASGRLHLLNRLDSATSGVILAAESALLAREIRSLFQRRNVHKLYYALVFGVPSTPQQAWRDMLAVQKRGGQIRTTHGAGSVPAECSMRVIRSRRGDVPLSLLSLEPKTGRSHQLRVQCAKRHLPMVGDATYGNFTGNRAFAKTTGFKRLFLHSLETQFDYTWEGRSFSFSARAELPKEFEAVW